MKPTSVIIDLAAERGGNCELSKANERVNVGGVTILAPTNIAADVAFDASQMFSHNLTKFLINLVEKDHIRWEADDEIIRDTLVTRGGEVVNARVRSSLGLPALEMASNSANQFSK